MKSNGIDRRRTLFMGVFVCMIIVLGSVSLPATAEADQKQYYAFYKIRISHPGNSEDYFVERRGPRSWVTIATCKSVSGRYADRQIRAVRGYKIMTKRGALPTVGLHSVECREE